MRRWVIPLGLVGCYHPTSFDQNVPCSAALTCPGDQVCDTTQSPPECVGQLGSGSNNNETDGGNTPMDGAVTACGICPSATPVCDSDSTTCRGCYSDSECGSHVCSESTGLCLADAQTLYVKNGGNDSNPCTHDLPCANVSRAAQLVDAVHDVIKIYDGDYNDSFLTTGATFLLSGEGNDDDNATIHFRAGAAVHDHIMELDGGTVVVEGLSFDGGMMESVRVEGGAQLSMFGCEILDSPIGSIDAQASTVNLYDVEIHDGQGTEAAINMSGGTLVMQRGLMYTLGGACIRVSGGAKYDVENSFLTGCAGEGFAQVGVLPSMAIFSFNTVVANLVGVTCVAGITVKNSIFAYSTNTPQTPACAAATYSLFSDTVAPGIGNIAGDPSFVASDDLHINFNSPGRDKADPNATATYDWDGEPRPHGPGFDIGADEHY